MDFQVKIRGFRVELGEIERWLLDHEQIKECVVLAIPGEKGSKNLCAYIVSSSELSSPELREYLSRDLPDYMVPAFFVFLDQIPLTPNRKVDRRALPAPKAKAGKDSSAPRSETQKKLAAIWSEILNINPIGIDDNFFELGGHSLLATILAARVHKEFQVKLALVEVFKTPTIRGLCQYIRDAVQYKHISIEPVEKKEYYVLSSAQQRLYILWQMNPESIGYNMPGVIPLSAETDREKLQRVFIQLIERHESLRTSFHMPEDDPVQKIHQDVDFEIEYHSARRKAQSAERKEERHAPCAGRYASTIKNFIRHFDLSRAPLLRVGLLKQETNKLLLLVDMHHIISDGVSHTILVREFMTLYRGESPAPLRIQYKDFAQWRNSKEEIQKIKHQEAFWLKESRGEIPVLSLPADFPRPALQTFAGSRVSFEIAENDSAALKTLAFNSDSTLYMVLLSVFTMLLSKLGSQEDIIIGTPIAGRRHVDLEKIIGMFVNTLALRNYPGGKKSFQEFLREVKERTLAALENQEYQFEDLVDRVEVRRDISRNPLFDVMFSMPNITDASMTAPGMETFTERNPDQEGESRQYHYRNITSKFDLTLTATGAVNRLLFHFTFNTALFKKETIEKFTVYFKNIIAFIAKQPEMPLYQIGIITPGEKKQVLYYFNDTDNNEYPLKKTIHQLFADQVHQTPNHIAVVGVHQLYELHQKGTRGLDHLYITYRELNTKSQHRASRFMEKGCNTDSIVGIITGPGIQMMASILGVLKAGGGYLPIDPDYPQERIQYMLADSGTNLLVTTSTLFEDKKLGRWEGETILIDKSTGGSGVCLNPQPAAKPGNFSYIIYTSGTTGKPKGVLVKHENLVNYVNWFSNAARLTGKDKTILTSSFGFDLGYTSLYPSLLKGGQLHILPKEIYMLTGDLLDYTSCHRISYLKMTPTFFTALANHPGFSSEACRFLRLVVLGGEAINAADVEKAYGVCQHLEIMNHYGPTEVTIGCIAQLIDPGTMETYKEQPTIGRPIFNTRVFILDIYLNLLPAGIAGELCLAGAGLARGYLNRPELTCEKFKIINYKLKIKNGSGALRADLNAFGEDTNKNKKVPGKRNDSHMSDMSHMSYIYKTGDLARWMADGNIEFLGRKDHQVKIRGFRIELAEIEYRLMKHEEIKEAVVVVRQDEDSNKFLCAYYIPVEKSKDKDYDNRDGAHGDQKVQIGTLREFLDRGLPDYMIPSYFVPMERFPLTSNKKIDRESLPDPDGYWARKGTTYLAPQTDLEKKIAQCWKKVLKKDKIGIYDNFFELGGNSLNIIRLTNELKIALGSEIPVVSLYRYLTISSFARHLKEQQSKTLVHGNERLPNQPVEALRRSKKVLKHTVQKTVGVRHARKK
jgi:tyrocidine synthetase-3